MPRPGRETIEKKMWMSQLEETRYLKWLKGKRVHEHMFCLMVLILSKTIIHKREREEWVRLIGKGFLEVQLDVGLENEQNWDRGDRLPQGCKTAGNRAMFVSSSPKVPSERQMLAVGFPELQQYLCPRLLRVLSSSQVQLPFWTFNTYSMCLFLFMHSYSQLPPHPWQHIT